MKTSVEIDIKAVGWNQKTGKPSKWQAVGILKDGKGNTMKRIYGDPASSEHNAWRELEVETMVWEDTARMVRAELYKEGKA